jgi:hypothetical protein
VIPVRDRHETRFPTRTAAKPGSRFGAGTGGYTT